MTIRELFIEWLTNSQLTTSLEARIFEQRHDLEARIADKDALIADLKLELQGIKVEIGELRSGLLPRRYDQMPQPPFVAPEFTGTLDWNAEVEKILQDEQERASQKEQ